MMGQTDTFYNHKVFLGWILNSFLHSLGLFYLWTFIAGDSDILSNGEVVDNWALGTMIYVTTLFTVLTKHCLIADTFIFLTTVAFFGSIVAFLVLFPIVFLLLISSMLLLDLL
jgi:phospholipid-transporting ATPase